MGSEYILKAGLRVFAIGPCEEHEKKKEVQYKTIVRRDVYVS